MNSITVAQLAASFPSGTPPLVIDVGRREAFVKDGKTISGALRRDPERVKEWVRELALIVRGADTARLELPGAIAVVLTSRSV